MWNQILQCKTFILVMNIYHCDKSMALLLNWINLMKTYYDRNENLSIRWKSIIVLKIHHCDENSSLMNFLNNDEDENSSLWWKFINWLRLIFVRKIHHLGENLSLWWKYMSGMWLRETRWMHTTCVKKREYVARIPYTFLIS